MFKFPELINL